MKKILILTCAGGGGHLSVSKALREHLENSYTIHESFIFTDPLAKFDFIRTLSFKKYNCEEFYNYFIQQKNFYILKLLYIVGVWHIKLRRKKIYSTLLTYIQNQKPDLIISVVPIINGIMNDVAQALQLPFLIVTADLDPSTYLVLFEKPYAKELNIAIPFDDQEIIHKITAAGIPHDKITVIGALVRQDFFHSKNKEQIKQQLSISNNKNIIMILMGGQGSPEITHYIDELLKLKDPTHLLICIGKNKKIRNIIENLEFPNHISKSVIGFTDTISDLMAISDLLITKPGPQTLCEALYMNIPMLLDATTETLFWEKFNLHFIQKHNLGEIIENYEQIIPRVSTLLNKIQYMKYKNNLMNFGKKNGGEEVKKIITRLIQ